MRKEKQRKIKKNTNTGKNNKEKKRSEGKLK